MAALVLAAVARVLEMGLGRDDVLRPFPMLGHRRVGLSRAPPVVVVELDIPLRVDAYVRCAIGIAQAVPGNSR